MATVVNDVVEAPGARNAAEDVAALMQRSLQWLVLTSLVYRVGVTVPSIFIGRAALGDGADVVLPLIVGVVVLDVGLMVVSIARPAWLRTRVVFFAADIVVLLGTTTVATLLLPPGLYLTPGPDVMTGFAWGTVGLWTAARGWRAGLSIVIASPLVLWLMATVNQVTWSPEDVTNAVFRVGYMAINYLATLAIVLLARRSASVTIGEAHRRGRIARQRQARSAMHDSALGDLDAIRLLSDRRSIGEEERLAIVGDVARNRVATWGEVSVGATGHTLVEHLDHRCRTLAVQGIQVQMAIRGRSDSRLEPESETALVEAAAEALRNAAKYAQVDSADMAVDLTDEEVVRVEVTDHGVGVEAGARPGNGVRDSLHGRMAAVGGWVAIRSTAGRGTTVTLCAPRIPRRGFDDIVDQVLRWFPVVPLGARLLILPFLGLLVGPLLEGGRLAFDVVTAVIVAAHVILLVTIGVGAWPVRRSALWPLLVDYGIAICFFVWLIDAERPDEVTTIDGTAPWTYVFLTIPLWFAVRRPRAGLAAIGVALVVLTVALLISGAPLGGGRLLVIVPLLIQLFVTSGYAALVVRMATRGARMAAEESERAGRDAAQVALLDDLAPAVMHAFDDIIRLVEAGGEAGPRLAAIKARATGAGVMIRSALDALGRADRADG